MITKLLERPVGEIVHTVVWFVFVALQHYKYDEKIIFKLKIFTYNKN